MWILESLGSGPSAVTYWLRELNQLGDLACFSKMKNN